MQNKRYNNNIRIIIQINAVEMNNNKLDYI